MDDGGKIKHRDAKGRVVAMETTEMQKVFVDSYVRNGFNGRAAAIAAGYAVPDNWRAVLNRPKVAEYLERQYGSEIRIARNMSLNLIMKDLSLGEAGFFAQNPAENVKLLKTLAQVCPHVEVKNHNAKSAIESMSIDELKQIADEARASVEAIENERATVAKPIESDDDGSNFELTD